MGSGGPRLAGVDRIVTIHPGAAPPAGDPTRYSSAGSRCPFSRRSFRCREPNFEPQRECGSKPDPGSFILIHPPTENPHVLSPSVLARPSIAAEVHASPPHRGSGDP